MLYFCERFRVCLVSGCVLFKSHTESSPGQGLSLCCNTIETITLKNSVKMGFSINCTDDDLLKIHREIKAKWHKSY